MPQGTYLRLGITNRIPQRIRNEPYVDSLFSTLRTGIFIISRQDKHNTSHSSSSTMSLTFHTAEEYQAAMAQSNAQYEACFEQAMHHFTQLMDLQGKIHRIEREQPHKTRKLASLRSKEQTLQAAYDSADAALQDSNEVSGMITWL